MVFCESLICLRLTVRPARIGCAGKSFFSGWPGFLQSFFCTAVVSLACENVRFVVCFVSFFARLEFAKLKLVNFCANKKMLSLIICVCVFAKWRWFLERSNRPASCENCLDYSNSTFGAFKKSKSSVVDVLKYFLKPKLQVQADKVTVCVINIIYSVKNWYTRQKKLLFRNDTALVSV